MKIRHRRRIALVLALCLLLGGCQASRQAASYDAYALGQVKMPNLPNAEKNASAYVKALDRLRGDGVAAGFVPALGAFTGKTAQTFADQVGRDNLIYSPANLYLALCLLSETTAGESRAQVLGLLGLETIEDARTVANQLWRNLYRDGETDKTVLNNSLWLNRQATPKQSAVKTLSEDYYASVFQVPMGDPATDQAIADWISANTGGLLSGGLQTAPETLLTLISTLYFKGRWVVPFPESRTAPGVFTCTDGSEQTVDYMHSTNFGYYYQGKGYSAAALPFRGGQTMWFLLPDQGEPAVELLDQALLDGGFPAEALEYDTILWTVPKFDLSASLDLLQVLPDLGITDVLDPTLADFSALTDTTPAWLTDARHSVRVKIDEEGCEAAAVTEVAAAGEPMTQRTVEMTLDRPFVFLITGTDGLPLFLAVVNRL